MQANSIIHVMHARPLTSAGLAALLQSRQWRVTLHGDQPERLALADLVVADYESGLALARAAAPVARAQRVLIVTHRDRAWDVRQALESRVDGYLLDDICATQLERAVRQLLAGARYLCPAAARAGGDPGAQLRLTPREEEVLRLLARGLCNKRIARELGIGTGTVKWHLRSLMLKLDATTRTQAVVAAAQHGLVGIGTPRAAHGPAVP